MLSTDEEVPTRSKSLCNNTAHEEPIPQSYRATSLPCIVPSISTAFAIGEWSSGLKRRTENMTNAKSSVGNGNDAPSLESQTSPVADKAGPNPVLTPNSIETGGLAAVELPSDFSIGVKNADVTSANALDTSGKASKQRRDSSPVEVTGSRVLCHKERVPGKIGTPVTSSSENRHPSGRCRSEQERRGSPGVEVIGVRKILHSNHTSIHRINPGPDISSSASGLLMAHLKNGQIQGDLPRSVGRTDLTAATKEKSRNTTSYGNKPALGTFGDYVSKMALAALPQDHTSDSSFRGPKDSLGAINMPSPLLVQALDSPGPTRLALKKRAPSPLRSNIMKRVKTETGQTRQLQPGSWTSPYYEPDDSLRTPKSEQGIQQQPERGLASPMLSIEPSVDLYGKGKRWTARTWTSSQYAALAQACESSFPFVDFEAEHKKSQKEVLEVFAAVIQTPLLSRCGRGAGELRGGLGEARVKERRNREKEMGHAQKRLRQLQEKDREAERIEMRHEIEMDVWSVLEREGWVKLEDARKRLAEKEKERQRELETWEQHAGAATPVSGFPSLGTPAGRARKNNRTKTIEEATEELQAASAELLKAKKAEERKMKRLEKNKKETGDVKEQMRRGKTLEKVGKPKGKCLS